MKKFELAIEMYEEDDTPFDECGPDNDPSFIVDNQARKTVDVIKDVLGEAVKLAAAEVAKAGGDVTGGEVKKLLDDVVEFEKRAVGAAYGKSTFCEWDLGDDPELAKMCDHLDPYTKPIVYAPLGGSAGLDGALGPLLAALMAERGSSMPNWSDVPGGGVLQPAPPYDLSRRPSPHSTPLARFFAAKPLTPPDILPLPRSVFEARCEVTSRYIPLPQQLLVSASKIFVSGAGGYKQRAPVLGIYDNSFAPCKAPKVALEDAFFSMCLDGVDDLVAVADQSCMITYRGERGVHKILTGKMGGAMTFLDGGKKLARASAYRSSVAVFELKTDSISGTNIKLDSNIKGISSWTPLLNSTNFVCASKESYEDSTEVFELDWNTGQRGMRYLGHAGKVTGLSTAEGRDNDFLTSCSDGVARLFDRRSPQPTLTFAIKDAEESGCSGAFANVGGLPFVFVGGTKTEQISAYDARLPGKALYSLATGNNLVRSLAWQASTNSLWAATDCLYADRVGGHHGYRPAENIRSPPGCNWPGMAYHDEKSFGHPFDAASNQLFKFAFKDEADPKILPAWGQSSLPGSFF
ncbi:hypothetical protein P7C70_g523, partial [Phenoliferia sp. Uapishka_3]